MITKLDASHLCVLKNWEAIAQMNECREQVKTHLHRIALKVLNNIAAQQKSQFSPNCDIKNEMAYFQLTPTPFENWNQSGEPLLALGIENIFVDKLMQLDSESTGIAFVYSPFRASQPIENSESDRLAAISPLP